MRLNKKIIIVSVFILLFTLLSSIAFAKPVTDVFAGGLLQINNFFEARQYEPYSKTIDFFFFALLFIAVYMMGARYAFKEIKRPEQVIVILLGLMTAFLLVLADISATVLLPYIHWLLYLLLFILYWHLLKGIKNPFWRFVLALLLTLLTIGLIQGLYNYLKTPKISGISAPSAPSIGIGGFFKDLFGSFRGISLPGVSAPGWPDWARGLVGVPSAAPSGGPTTLPPAVTPTQPPTQAGGGGLPWWLWALMAILIALAIYYGRGLLPKKPEEEKKPEKLTVEQIIKIIEDTIIKKREAKNKINEKVYGERTPILKSADKAQAFVNSYTKDDIAHIWEDPVRNKIRESGEDFLKFVDKDKEFVTELKKLKDVEVDLHRKLEEWKKFFDSNRVDYGNILQELADIVAKKTDTRQIKQIGIIWLIIICYNYVKRDENYAKELAQWLTEDNIENLLKDRFGTVHQDGKKLRLNVASEIEIVRIIGEKIELQIRTLEALKNKISGTVPTPTSEETDEFEPEKIKFDPIYEDPIKPDEEVYEPIDQPLRDVELWPWFRLPQNQHDLGACTAFASCSMYEYIHNRFSYSRHPDDVTNEIINDGLQKSMEMFVYAKMNLSKLYQYYYSRADKNNDTGSWPSNACINLQTRGVCLVDYWPYIPSLFKTLPPQDADKNADDQKIQKHFALSLGNDVQGNKEKLARALMDGLPILIVITPRINFHLAVGKYFIGSDEDTMPVNGLHSIVIVGYRKNLEVDGKDFGEAFKIRNSWGKKWGHGGWLWMNADYLTELIMEVNIAPRVMFGKNQIVQKDKGGISIENLNVDPNEAIEEGIAYRTPLKISSKILRGAAPFKAYCFVYKSTIDERGDRKIVQIYPASLGQLKSHKQRGFEFQRELLESAKIEYIKNVEKTSKTLNEVGDEIIFSSENFGDLDAGQYTIVFFVRNKTERARKAINIRINKTRHEQPKLEFGLKEPKVYEEPEQFYIISPQDDPNNEHPIQLKELIQLHAKYGFKGLGVKEYQWVRINPDAERSNDIYEVLADGFVQSGEIQNVIPAGRLGAGKHQIRVRVLDFLKVNEHKIRDLYSPKVTINILLSEAGRYILTLTPYNNYPNEPINLASFKHKTKNEAVEIGRGDSGIVLEDSPVDDEKQAFIQFVPEDHYFYIFKNRMSRDTKILINRRRVVEFAPLTGGEILTINGYNFKVDLATTDQTEIEDYEKKISRNLKLAKNFILKIISTNGTADKPIMLASFMHDQVENVVEIGRIFSTNYRYVISLPDNTSQVNSFGLVQFYPDKQAFLLSKWYQQGPPDTVISINGETTEGGYLKDGDKFAVNDYQFRVIIRETSLVSTSQLEGRFPYIVKLRGPTTASTPDIIPEEAFEAKEEEEAISKELTDFDEWIIREESKAERARNRGRISEYKQIFLGIIKGIEKERDNIKKRISKFEVIKARREKRLLEGIKEVNISLNRVTDKKEAARFLEMIAEMKREIGGIQKARVDIDGLWQQLNKNIKSAKKLLRSEFLNAAKGNIYDLLSLTGGSRIQIGQKQGKSKRGSGDFGDNGGRGPFETLPPDMNREDWREYQERQAQEKQPFNVIRGLENIKPVTTLKPSALKLTSDQARELAEAAESARKKASSGRKGRLDVIP